MTRAVEDLCVGPVVALGVKAEHVTFSAGVRLFRAVKKDIEHFLRELFPPKEDLKIKKRKKNDATE
jgi:hypothetical protein